MVTRFNFGAKFILFTNSYDKKITIVPFFRKDVNFPIGHKDKNFYFYHHFKSFILVPDGIIVSFEPHSEATDEEIRRNIFKFDEEGEIVWIVEDHYKKIVLPSDISELAKDRFKKAWFQNLYYNDEFRFVNLPPNKIFADQPNGSYYSVDIATGEIEFLAAFKD